MEFKGSETEKNLMIAFTGESVARNKYTFFANAARKEGLEGIARTFEETAENETEHGEIWFKLLAGIGTTAENLLRAAAGESEEHLNMYAKMAETARKEGFTEIADKFDAVAKIESEHELRYRKLLRRLEEGNTFKLSDGEPRFKWRCLKCGNIVEGDAAPDKCPVCDEEGTYVRIGSEY